MVDLILTNKKIQKLFCREEVEVIDNNKASSKYVANLKFTARKLHASSQISHNQTITRM